MSPLEEQIDAALEKLLAQAPTDSTAKLADITKLIEAAVKWYEVKHRPQPGEGFGAALDGKGETRGTHD